VAWQLLGTRTIPSPDAALGDGKGRSAAFATFARQFDLENTP
jgi:hypothetical protein